VADDKQSILIVEDDLDLAEMLNAYFRVQGYEVLTAAWGEDAVRICQRTMPDIVLLDIRLPDIDGYEVCRQLRSNRRTDTLPIIFLTERRDRADKLQGLELGGVDYITKPFDIQELRLRVRNALRRADQQALINPVTGLAEGKLLDEQLEKLLKPGDWSVLVMSVRGLSAFREMYGFVAADDVLRAVSLMINNIAREVSGADDFVGHISSEEFVVITTEGRAKEINDRVQARLTQSMDYFYPLKDRPAEGNPQKGNRLSLATRVISASKAHFTDTSAVKAAIQNANS
jgi:DNA-binding response OmpR family regulator